MGSNCEYCGELFDQQEDLNIHSGIPHIRGCLRKGCGMKFVTLSGLIKHTFNMHKKSDMKSTEKSESRLVSGNGMENETASNVGLKNYLLREPLFEDEIDTEA